MNIRGFILYFLGLIQLEMAKRRATKKQVEWKKKGPKKWDISYDRRRIDKTLKLLSESRLKDFPFFLHYQAFKEALPKNFIIDVLKQIAEELQYQLDTSDIDFLKYWVTRRYYDAIANHFGALEWISPYLFIKNIDLETRKKLKDFRVAMLSDLVKYLSAEEQHRKKALESYRTGY